MANVKDATNKKQQ